jgi:hypothetical protein
MLVVTAGRPAGRCLRCWMASPSSSARRGSMCAGTTVCSELQIAGEVLPCSQAAATTDTSTTVSRIRIDLGPTRPTAAAAASVTCEHWQQPSAKEGSGGELLQESQDVSSDDQDTESDAEDCRVKRRRRCRDGPPSVGTPTACRRAIANPAGAGAGGSVMLTLLHGGCRGQVPVQQCGVQLWRGSMLLADWLLHLHCCGAAAAAAEHTAAAGSSGGLTTASCSPDHPDPPVQVERGERWWGGKGGTALELGAGVGLCSLLLGRLVGRGGAVFATVRNARPPRAEAHPSSSPPPPSSFYHYIYAHAPRCRPPS